jgi:hypothetical protein
MADRHGVNQLNEVRFCMLRENYECVMETKWDIRNVVRLSIEHVVRSPPGRLDWMYWLCVVSSKKRWLWMRYCGKELCMLIRQEELGFRNNLWKVHRSRCCEVGIVTGQGTSSKASDRLWGSPSLQLMSTRISSWGVKRSGLESRHSPQYSTEFKNTWLCISSSPIRLRGVHWKSLTFTLTWCRIYWLNSFILYCVVRQVCRLFHSEFSRVRSSASSSNFQYPILSFRSSSSCLRLLARLLFISILPCNVPSVTCFIRQFLRKMWPMVWHFVSVSAISCK